MANHSDDLDELLDSKAPYLVSISINSPFVYSLMEDLLNLITFRCFG